MFQIEGEERDRTTEYRPHPGLDCRWEKEMLSRVFLGQSATSEYKLYIR